MKIVLGINGKVKEINVDGQKIKADAKAAAITGGNAVKHGVSTILSAAIEGLSRAKNGIKVNPDYLKRLQDEQAQAERIALAIKERKEKIEAEKQALKELKAGA